MSTRRTFGARSVGAAEALVALGGAAVLLPDVAHAQLAQVSPAGETWMVTLQCLGDAPGPRFLDGRTGDGTVALAPHTDPPFTGTRWAMTGLAGDAVRLRCLGEAAGPRHLDGATREARVRLLPTMPAPPSGERWRAAPHPMGDLVLECLGDGPGTRYLDGRTQEGTVALAPATGPPFTGTRWRVAPLGTIVTLRCEGEVPGPARYLDGRTQGAGSVGLASMAAGRFTGAHWLLQDVPGGVTLCCLGEAAGANRYLDGRTQDGSIGLAPQTGPPFSGTRWELTPLPNPDRDVDPGAFVHLRCLGGLADPAFRFLDGHTQADEQTVRLAPSTAAPYTGTRWRLLSPAIWYEPCPGLYLLPGRRGPRPAEVLRTVRVGQLTGGQDPEGWRLLNGDTGRWGVPGVDLGASCDHEGTLYLFFGDVVRGWRKPGEGPVHDADLIAATDDTAVTPGPGGGLRLQPVLRGPYFDPFRVEGPIGVTPTFEVPSGAFSHAQRVFVFTHIWDHNAREPRPEQGCYLVSKAHPFAPGPFQPECLFSPRTLDGRRGLDQFGGVAPWKVRNAEHRWLPPTEHRDGVVLFGIGQAPSVGGYSATQLAWAPLKGPQAPDLTDVRYLTDKAQPWDRDPQGALALFGKQPNLQNVSAAFLEGPGLWIVLHLTANTWNRPSGPVVAHLGTPPRDWRYEFELFDPARERAYGAYMHWPGLGPTPSIYEQDPPLLTHADGRREPFPESPGWAYGTFLLAKFTRWDPTTRELDLYFVLSLSSPYQVQLMHSRIRLG